MNRSTGRIPFTSYVQLTFTDDFMPVRVYSMSQSRIYVFLLYYKNQRVKESFKVTRVYQTGIKVEDEEVEVRSV